MRRISRGKGSLICTSKKTVITAPDLQHNFLCGTHAPARYVHSLTVIVIAALQDAPNNPQPRTGQPSHAPHHMSQRSVVSIAKWAVPVYSHNDVHYSHTEGLEDAKGRERPKIISMPRTSKCAIDQISYNPPTRVFCNPTNCRFQLALAPYEREREREIVIGGGCTYLRHNHTNRPGFSIPGRVGISILPRIRRPGPAGSSTHCLQTHNSFIRLYLEAL